MYTSGEIIRIKPEILLQHKLFDLSNRDLLLSVISYELEEYKGKTKFFQLPENSIILSTNSSLQTFLKNGICGEGDCGEVKLVVGSVHMRHCEARHERAAAP